MSVGCRLDRPSHGVVVKPTWLLITRWTVPFTVKPAAKADDSLWGFDTSSTLALSVHCQAILM
jgi:hypothetical protein